MTKKLVMIGTAVMTTLLALVVVWQFRIAVVYVLVSLTFAAALRPLVNRLVGKGFVVRAAWILLYLVVLGGFGFLLFQISKTTINEVQELAHTVSVQDEWRLPIWLEGSSFQQALLARLPPPSKLFEAVTGDQGQLVLPTLLGFTQGIAGIVSGVLVILFLSLYWIVSQTHFERLWLSLLPAIQRKQARDIWRTIEPEVGAYIRSQIVHSLLAGLLLGLGYWALGSPYPTLLALAGALAALIPVFGVIMAVIAPLLVGMLTSAQLGLFTVLYTLVALIALGVWVKPLLFSRRWDSPVMNLVILIAFANAFGLLGVILAPPISAVCQILWNHLVSYRLTSGAATQISHLKERVESVWAAILAMDESPMPLLTSSMERLTRLIEKAEPILEVASPAEPAKSGIPIAPQTEQEGSN